MVLSERFVFITVPIGAAWLGRRRSRRGRANNWPVDGTGPVVYRSGRAVMVCVLFVFLGFICLVYGRAGQCMESTVDGVVRARRQQLNSSYL